MPLTPCPDCGKDVSTRAPNCPQCGHPMAAFVRKDANGSGLGWVLLVVTGVLLLAALVIYSMLSGMATVGRQAPAGSGVPRADEAWANAQILCRAAMDTDSRVQCTANQGTREVGVYVPMRASEAAWLCRRMAEGAAQQGLRFGGGWELRLFPPLGGEPLAVCPLP
jgi:hypothetical protein